jgi:Spore coat associated protein JA (CotJA)
MIENIRYEKEARPIKCYKMSQCIPQEMAIQNVKLAAAYVPFQKFCSTSSPVEGLKRGTIFPELYSPYDGKNKKHKHHREESGGEES